MLLSQPDAVRQRSDSATQTLFVCLRSSIAACARRCTLSFFA